VRNRNKANLAVTAFQRQECLWKNLAGARSRDEEDVVFDLGCELRVEEKYSLKGARDYTVDNRIQKTENRRQISGF
jgi:hypothetical protein